MASISEYAMPPPASALGDPGQDLSILARTLRPHYRNSMCVILLNGRYKMHATFDKAENFETLLMSEFNSLPTVSTRLPGEDLIDAGYRLVTAISDDFALDMMVLDVDNIK